MKKAFLLTLCFSFFFIASQAQKIKTKVSESTFKEKPDAVKVEEFDPANMFLFLGVGAGYRTGEILTGVEAAQVINPGITYKTTDDANPLKVGFSVDLGFRYFFNPNFGFGIRGNAFMNKFDFMEKDYVNYPAKAKTSIYQGYAEGLYRFYPGSDQSLFLYGSLGLGWCLIDQVQNYERASRVTNVNDGFLLVRPAIGVNIPIWDRFHAHSEIGYGYSQGKINSGSLSLSQAQFSIGIHYRVNAF